jgi:hypothetical protein
VGAFDLDKRSCNFIFYMLKHYYYPVNPLCAMAAQGKGASGVALCYHKFDEFKNLPKDQQDELIEWNKANGRGKGGKGGGKGGKGGANETPWRKPP